MVNVFVKSPTEAYDRSVAHAEQVTRVVYAADDDMMLECAYLVESGQRVAWENRLDPVCDAERMLRNTDQLDKFLASLS